MKAIIIDDEKRARHLLEVLVNDYCEDVEIVEMAEDVPSGVKAIHKHKPDLVFLDVEMPGYSGFQLLDFFDELPFEVIFTTAYRQYALQAFEVSAIDYLLKPIEVDRLRQAIEKVKERVDPPQTEDKLDALKQNMQQEFVNRIALPVSDGLLFVDVDEIVLLEAARAYTHIFLANDSQILVSRNIKSFERMLKGHPFFFRPHRSYLINLNRVRQYSRQDGGYIIMDNDKNVSLARDQKEAFLQVFEK